MQITIMVRPMAGSLPGHKYCFVLVLAIIAGCAKIGAPSGGPKDKEPPVVLRCIPDNGSKNFTGNKITVTFNKFVVLSNVTQKLMVSPPIKKKPKISLHKKSMIIQYNEKLHDSTTYTFYFEDAIRDLNEGNILDNYQFVFSTGPELDSLSVTGNVYNALNLEPPEETLVLLYHELYDSAFVKHLPSYLSKVDKKGYFRINNVKAGKYRLYALKDLDNSKNYNLADEQVAFMNTSIDVTTQDNYLPVVKDTVKIKKPVSKAAGKAADTVVMKGEYKLILFQAPQKKHYLTSSARSLPYKLTFTLSLPPDSSGFDFSIPEAGKNSYYVERSKNKDTITVWLTDIALFSTSLIKTNIRYPFTDSTGIVIQKHDTVSLRFITPQSTRAKAKPPHYTVNSNLSAGGLKPGEQIYIQSKTPLRLPDTSRIRFYEITGSGKVNVPFKFVRDTVNSCRLTIPAHLQQGKNYLFIANHGAFGDIYGQDADSAGYKLTVRNDDSFGKLTINIKGYSGNRIIQLLTSDEQLVKEIRMDKDGKVEFPYLERGKYRLRVIYDLNGDGKWTTGDFSKGLQPEPASYYPQELNVKENWYMTQDWDISQQNVKALKSTNKNQGKK
ncbi:MAG: Ig-like domain-containing domain [Bacteroidales bacterium]